MRDILLCILFCICSYDSISQKNDSLVFIVSDELGIPVTNFNAKLVTIRNIESKDFFSENNVLKLLINPNDTVFVEFKRGTDFYWGSSARIYFPRAIPKNDTVNVKLTAMQTIGHNFYELLLDQTYSNSNIINLPDTISIVTNPIDFNYSHKPYVQFSQSDSNEYRMNYIDPNSKIIVQGSNYNQIIRIELLNNDSVLISIGSSSQTYFVIGFRTYRGYEWRLEKEIKVHNNK